MPSAPQKRACANGKSLKIQATTVVSKLAAFLLNSLTDAAQVPVSILGKIFKITFLPEKSDKFLVAKSTVVKLKFGALVPAFGKSPMVFILFPFKVIKAIIN